MQTETENAPAPGVDTATELAGELLNEAPAPSQRADQIAANLKQERDAKAAGSKSERKPGETRGRHKKDCTCPICQAKKIGQKVSADTTSDVDPYTPAAVVLVGTITGAFQVIFDAEEWAPKKAETDQMVKAWRSLLERYGVQDVPPWVGIAIATAGYCLPRMGRPNTKGKLTRFIEWARRAKA